jgi:hypothetical protein
VRITQCENRGDVVAIFKKPLFYWGNWRAQGDDFRTFLGQFVACLPQAEFRDGFGF